MSGRFSGSFVVPSTNVAACVLDEPRSHLVTSTVP
jgi:hypothetical protein